MPRKTRREKERSQVRQPLLLHTPAVFSVTDPKVPRAIPQAEHGILEDRELHAIRRDVGKTLLLTSFAIIGEILLLFYVLRGR